MGPSGELSRLIESHRLDKPYGITVYNFSVEDDHNYFVIANLAAFQDGSEPVLVHNAQHIYSNYTNRVVKQPRQIALGKDPYFKQLSEKTGAANWREWKDVGLTRRTTDKRFGRAFHQVSDRADRIHFSLDGISDIDDAVTKGGKLGFTRDNMTNAELHHIMTNPELLSKTTFYREGVEISATELLKGLF